MPGTIEVIDVGVAGAVNSEFIEQCRTAMKPWYFLQRRRAPSRGEGRARPGGARRARAGCEDGANSRVPGGAAMPELPELARGPG